ncbi:MAG TPA: tRNA (adenosine(37)-N6)-threonylcarbamoyltransferase complex dimerization subunit type 1 TsaB [Patescibacteria group bacterium]|nr:tRNA (adenosine(37)-N6)-threonylcarbamoyltransferase complex dimerization subunit type 1 TsaB [Patescibacteria group bacterium]
MILAIDTAGPNLAICLFWPKKIQKVLKWHSEKKSENLLIRIDQLLSKNKVNLKDLKTIIVNHGPGSFTGLRVGISCANALAESLKIPIIGIKNEKNILKMTQAGFIKFKNHKFSKNRQVLPFYNFKLK